MEDKVIVIPSIHFEDAYYGYIYPQPSFRDKYPARGDWVEVGEPILETEPGVVIKSPISGLVAKSCDFPGYYGNTNLIAIIPQKNYKLPGNVADFLYREYIDLDLEKWVMDGGFDKASRRDDVHRDPTEHMSEVREAVRNYQLIEEGIDDELKLLIESIKSES